MMKRSVMQWGIGLFFSFSAIISSASIDSDLNGYFNNLGFDTNTTSPSVYNGQAAGYYNGGSVFARNSVRDVQIAQINLPSLHSGCGGIDLFTGGFSFVNSQQLVQVMKNIMNNAAGYSFNLALESATPEIANAMKYMNTLANQVNSMNINSCETAAGLVGSAWPRTREAQQQVCQDIGTNKGLFTDYAAARQGCGPGQQTTATLNGAPDAYKSMVINNTNIAWQALQQNSFLKSDPQLAELFLSLSGTIIITNPGNSDSSNQQYSVLPSLAADQSILKALLHGGQARIYHCDETTQCLHPIVQTMSVSSSTSLASQVSTLLNSMVDKIETDQALNPKEIGLLNATRLPMYKILNVQAAFAGNKSVLDVDDYAEVIATDILFQYLDEDLSIIRASSATLQYPETVMNNFSKSIDEARASVRAAEHSAYTQVTMAAQLIAQTQTLEQMLAGSLSSQMNTTLQWADNLRQ